MEIAQIVHRTMVIVMAVGIMAMATRVVANVVATVVHLEEHIKTELVFFVSEINFMEESLYGKERIYKPSGLVRHYQSL